jgi:hypothetical protein
MQLTHLGKFFCVVLASGSLFACSNELKGEISVDGTSFVLDSCRSGEVYGFRGVEAVSKEGAKLRIMGTPAGGEAIAFYMAPGESTGVELGKCGSFEVATQNSTINNVKNVRGQANLACEAQGHTIKGSFTFSNCH